MYRKLNRVILRQHQWNLDRGWLQLWAQEEAAKVWVMEGVQVLGIACWHTVHTVLDGWCTHKSSRSGPRS